MSRKQKPGNHIVKQIEPVWLKHPFIIIIIVALIVYIKTAGFGFVGVDDDEIIVNKYDKISDLSNLPEAFTSQYGFKDSTPYYRPIINLSFFIDAQISGKNPGWYHIANLIFHTLASSFLFMLMLKSGLNKTISLFLSLIFLVHPLLTNSVVWIAGRNDLIAGIFCLLSFIYFLKYIGDLTNKDLFLTSLFYLFGILSKESVFVLPFACLVYLFIFKRKSFSKNILIKLIGIWLIPIIISQLLKFSFVHSIGNVGYGFTALLANIRVIPEVIIKAIFPVNISVLPTFSSVRSYLGLIFLIVILILPFVVKRIDKKKFYFGIFWFFLFLLPGLLVVYANQSQSFDYLDTRDYIPVMGLILSAAVLIPETITKTINIRFVSVGLIILFVFSILTFFQSNLYRNPVNFAENAVQSNPERPFFYQKLADYYFAQNDYNKAAEYLKQAIQRDPGAFLYYKNLSLAYLHLKQPMNAVPVLEKAFELNNKDRDVLNALIRVKYELHNYKECLFYVNKAIEMGGKVDQGFLKSLQDSVTR